MKTITEEGSVRLVGDEGSSYTGLAIDLPYQEHDCDKCLHVLRSGLTKVEEELDQSHLLAQREHQMALLLQEALQPPLPEQSAGLEIGMFYKPAVDGTRVGGDFFDVFPLDGRRTVLVLGDVAGKGLEAAAHIATLRYMLRYALYSGAWLDEAIERLNNILTHHRLLDGFASAFVGIYDSGTSVLSYVSCGHEIGLVRRAASGHIDYLPPSGMVLGAVEGERYTQETVLFGQGDTLLLYTDGATDAVVSAEERLGIMGIVSLLEKSRLVRDSKQLAKQLGSQINHVAQGHLADDVCLLAAVTIS